MWDGHNCLAGSSGILPVNGHVVINIFKISCINSFMLITHYSMTKLSIDLHYY